MLLLIDNYDSFTYNLYQYLCELGQEVEVVRNDKVTLDEIAAWKPERIVISPGPCTPKEAGISTEVVRRFGSSVPLLGVCLGHQCIGVAYGATVAVAGEIMHGKNSPEQAWANFVDNVVCYRNNRCTPRLRCAAGWVSMFSNE